MFHGFIIQIGTYSCAKVPVGSYWFISPKRHIFVLISESYTYTRTCPYHIHILIKSPYKASMCTEVPLGTIEIRLILQSLHLFVGTRRFYTDSLYGSTRRYYWTYTYFTELILILPIRKYP